MTLRLHTFGAVYLERDGQILGGAHSQRRRLAFLAFLAAAERPVVSRARLIALLWPESDEASGRHSLSQLLYTVRHDLGANVIVVDATTVRLDADALPSDARAFDDAVRAGRPEDAVAQYQGAFLDDFHVEGAPELNRWIDEERARRAHLCARALDRLADSAETSTDWHRAVEWLRQRVALDVADGVPTLRLMRALVAIGDRAGAARVAQVHETFIRVELEDEPDPSIVHYAEELRRADRAPRPAASAPAETRTLKTNAPREDTARALAPDPADASPPAVPARIPATPPPRARRAAPLRWVIAAGLTLIAGAAFLAQASSGMSLRRLAGDGGGRDTPATVIVGDLGGPDAALAMAVREALRAELVNAKGVRLASDQGMRELRSLMRIAHDSALTTQQLLTLAARGGAHVAVTGSVIPVGEGAQIILELLDPSTARTIRTFTERPDDAPATLDAVGRIARSIGAAVSRTPLDTTVRPLPAVTTASLAALKSYALARQIAASGFRREAVAPAERAVSHDSTFVLAHYFLGDLLWFIDEQTHSEAHLTKAFELRNTVPAREQLVIRARYEQLARDQPDSALAYWQLLADASPGDVLAYEGRTWALRALGRHEEAAASADTAMRLEPSAVLPNTTNAMYSWLSVGDTTSAIEVARRVAERYPGAAIEAQFFAALFRDPHQSLDWVDSTTSAENRHWRRHLAHVARKDVAAARVALDSVIRDDRVQFPPNALLHQGYLELLRGDGKPAAARYARAALDWTRKRDLSPPAIGRLSERIADLAARAGDDATIGAAILLVRERDRNRSLRTYVLALKTLDAARAYANGRYAEAARRAAEARQGVYFSRSLSTVVLLEADARRASGDAVGADSLEHLVDTHQIVDGHFEAWAILRALRR